MGVYMHIYTRVYPLKPNLCTTLNSNTLTTFFMVDNVTFLLVAACDTNTNILHLYIFGPNEVYIVSTLVVG